MGIVIGALLVLIGMYLFYMAIQFFLIPDDKYVSYKKALTNVKSDFLFLVKKVTDK